MTMPDGEEGDWLFWPLVFLSIIIIVVPPPGDEYIIVPAIWGWYLYKHLAKKR